MRVRALITAIAALSVVATALLAPTASAAPGAPSAASPNITPTKTIRACVNRNTGEIRVRTGRRCPSGWRKMSWGSSGPAGPIGPAGPAGSAGQPGPAYRVLDANNVVLGTFAGYYAFGANPIVMATAADGGLFAYLMSGQLYDSNNEVLYAESTCNDLSAQWFAMLETYELPTKGSSGRLVQSVRADNGSPQVIKNTFKLGDAPSPVNVATPMWYRNPLGGLCVPKGTYQANSGWWRVPLVPVPSPAVGAGPLRVTP